MSNPTEEMMAAHAEMARKLERAEQTIRDLRKRMATVKSSALRQAEAHDAQMSHMKKRVSATEVTFKDLSAQATEAWRLAAVARNAQAEAESRLNEILHPPPWKREGGQ